MIQTSSYTVEAMLLYSYSAELLDTVVCFFDFQEINESPNLTKKPDTDLFVFGHDAQSESQYTTIVLDLLLLIKIPKPGCLLTYLIILIAASQ